MQTTNSTNESIRVEDHLGLVRSVVYRFCRSGRVEDSDLYSVGCLALVEAARTFDPSRAKFCTWATRLIKQSVIDEVRKSARSKERPDQGPLDKMEDPHGGFPMELVVRAVSGSKSDSKEERECKMVLRGHYLDEKSLSQLGRELGISKEAVRKRVASAILMVRKNSLSTLENVP